MKQTAIHLVFSVALTVTAAVAVASAPKSFIHNQAAKGTNPYALYIGATLLEGEIPGMFGGFLSSDKNALKAWISAGKATADNPLAVAYWSVWEYETETTRYDVVTPYCYLVAEGRSSYSFFPKGKYEYGEQFHKYCQYYAGHPAFAINASNP